MATLDETFETLATLRGSHKLTQLFAGNLVTEILFATALGLFARGLAFEVSIAELLAINISVSLFSTLIPVPGGIGIVEGGLVVGLAAAGMAHNAAVTAVLLLLRVQGEHERHGRAPATG